MLNFEPGDLIYSSKPYVYVLNNDVRGKRCDYCFSKQNGLKRCSQCSFMYFCNKECQAKAWENHKEECKCIRNASPKLPTASLRLIANILFKIKKCGYDEPPEVIYGHQMTFRRLMSHSKEIKKNLKTCQQMVALIGTLKHYIGEVNVPPSYEFVEIFGKLCINSFSICDGEMQSIGSGIYLGGSIFDHSCDPNAEVVFNGTTIIIRAVKKIPHTDVTQIHISYIEQLQLLCDRQDSLKEQYYFCCQCPRCISPYYEDLMTETIIDKKDAEILVLDFKKKFEYLKQLKKDKISASKIFDECLEVLEKQDGVLAGSHIYRIKVLEIAFDACIVSNQWVNALITGKKLIEPYKLLYGTYHPTTGIHLFKIGKIQNFQGLIESAKINLLQAEEILKITHGIDHPLYKNLLEILHECETSENRVAFEE